MGREQLEIVCDVIFMFSLYVQCNIFLRSYNVAVLLVFSVKNNYFVIFLILDGLS